MKFKVGDQVRLKTSSAFYKDGTPDDAKDVDGVVYEIDDEEIGGFRYRVKWPGNRQETYRVSDLELSQSYLNELKLKKVLGLNE